MAAISFKSVGDLATNPRSVQEPQPKPVGIITPVSLARKIGNPLAMSTSVVDQMIDNFRNMLLTNHGERLPLYDFGANLRALVTERLSQTDYDEQAMILIKATTEKYMPFISLNTFETQVLAAEENAISRIKILIDFSIPRISTSVKKVEVIISNIG
jgi:phage baseplate assembly protein W